MKETFRNPWLFGLGWLCSVGALVVFGAVAVSGPGPHPGAFDYIGTAVFGLIMSAAFGWGTRMRVEVDDNGITAVNYLSTNRVVWADFDGATANYSGLWLRRHSGPPVRALGIARPNGATWLHRETMCDRVIARLNELAQEHRSLE